jgi:single-strand DNA-binding protein
MAEHLTVRGFVASDLSFFETADKLHIVSFRLGAPDRRIDRATGEWGDADMNWFTVKVFRELARNVMASLRKGERVVVTGRLKISQYRRSDGTYGTSAEVLADTVGHDLLFGVSRYLRTPSQRQEASEASHAVPAEDAEAVPPDVDAGTGEVLSGAYGEPGFDGADYEERGQGDAEDGEDDAGEDGRGVGAGAA